MRTMFAIGAAGLLAASAAGQVTLSAWMTADNAFNASISTDPTAAGSTFLSGTNWPTTYNGSVVLPGPGTYYLQVRAQDAGRPEMLLGRFTLDNALATFGNGTQTLLTGAAHWTVSHTGFGVAPTVPVVYGPNGMSPWGNFPAMGSAQFIWHPVYQSTVYFTTQITVVPAPTSLALLGIAALGLRRRR